MLEKTSSPPRIISSFLFRATIRPRRAFHKTSEKFGETVSRKFRARKAVLCLPWCYWLWTPHSNQAAHKNTFQTFIPQKIPESNVLNPKNSFDYPRHLKSGVRGGTPDFKWRGARNCYKKNFPSSPTSYRDFWETGLKCLFSSISNDSRKLFCNVGEVTFESCKGFQMFSF